MQPLAPTDLAQPHEGQLDVALKSTVAVTESAHALEPVTPDPFIEDLGVVARAERRRLHPGESLGSGELHERQRSRVVASLLAVEAPAKSPHPR